MEMKRRFVILAEGRFGPLESKTANQALRYIPEQVTAVIDSRSAGRTAQAVLGFGGTVPVVADLASSLSCAPTALLVGIAPSGGKLPAVWRSVIREAIQHRLTIVSGLHTSISDDQEFATLAREHNVELVDLRKCPVEYEVISKGNWKTRREKTILTVGTDSNVGKMTASLELHRAFLSRGLKSDFVATGQTGILLAGEGVAVDSIASDYVAGAIERELDLRTSRRVEYFHVEGQGSLTHQGYSSVTLGLLHGVMPDAMIMVHHPLRRQDDYGLSLENIVRLIELHESVLAPFKPSKVVGIAINGALMDPGAVKEATRSLEEQTGLPAADVLTEDVRKLTDALVRHFESAEYITV